MRILEEIIPTVYLKSEQKIMKVWDAKILKSNRKIITIVQNIIGY